MEIRIPCTEQEWKKYYDLRYRILREPLGKERGSERNEGDELGIHFALFKNEDIVGVARLDRIDETVAQVRFVAVETTQQGSGLGKQLMTAVEREAATLGYSKMILHARDYALPFYKKLEYTLVGPSYKLFDALQHFEMFKEI